MHQMVYERTLKLGLASVIDLINQSGVLKEKIPPGSCIEYVGDDRLRIGWGMRVVGD